MLKKHRGMVALTVVVITIIGTTIFAMSKNTNNTTETSYAEITSSMLDKPESVEPMPPDEYAVTPKESPTEQKPNITTVNCTDNIPCFIAAVTKKQNAYYRGEPMVVPIPGVSIRSTQVWDFEIPTDGSIYKLTIKKSNQTVNFADNWFERYYASSVFPAELRQQIETATYPSEQELAQLDDDARRGYEQAIAQGESPQDITKELIAFSTHHTIWSAAHSPVNTYTETCTLRDVTKLTAALGRWNKGTFSPTDLSFAVCTKTYGS